MTRGQRACVLACAVAATLGGCRAGPRGQQASIDAPAPGIEEVMARHNERVARLDRLWARAVVQLRYPDEQGRTRSAQGEGHLQVIQPDRLALSVGKLGETLYWLGADAERHWAFELGDVDRALIGRHENVGQPCMRSIGAPVHPLDLLDLLGVTPLPQTTRVTGRGEQGEVIVEAPSRSGVRTMWVHPDTLLPVRVAIRPHDPHLGEVVAELSGYEGVEQSDEGGFHPQAPSRVVARHDASASRIQIDLSDMNDGARRGRLPEAAFSFDALVRALGPDAIVVLDEACAHPALFPGELARVQP